MPADCDALAAAVSGVRTEPLPTDVELAGHWGSLVDTFDGMADACRANDLAAFQAQLQAMSPLVDAMQARIEQL
ncbi:hypothetical protein [Kineococcus rubinsiae]|uniref:hypothetical protein n=1 Tax=Kineococcus rubinsiae TaxID=2609562 RepID=UPI0014315FFB|nr:hypothetical protein [Kineococcus rubinsiae]NIZ90783.1 hypothetical protein [Kineococcus rubinsiae]